MGYSISWFAVPEAHAESFFRKLDLVDSGESEDFPESMISTARLSTGWQVLWYNKYDCPFPGKDAVIELSKSHDLLVCTIEDHCMDCAATLWRERRRLWHLHHDGCDGPKGLEVEGDLPPCFPAIRDEMEREQLAAGGAKAGVDYIFEIPLRVARTLTGFKHDENSTQIMDGIFHVLTLTKPVTSHARLKPGFFSR